MMNRFAREVRQKNFWDLSQFRLGIQNPFWRKVKTSWPVSKKSTAILAGHRVYTCQSGV